MIKILQRSGIQSIYLNIIKAINRKPIADIILNRDKIDAIPLKSGRSHGCPLSSCLFNIVLEVLARAIRNQKRTRGYKMERKNSRCHYLRIIVHTIPKNFYQRTPIADKLSKVAEYKINSEISSSPLYK